MTSRKPSAHSGCHPIPPRTSPQPLRIPPKPFRAHPKPHRPLRKPSASSGSPPKLPQDSPRPSKSPSATLEPPQTPQNPRSPSRPHFPTPSGPPSATPEPREDPQTPSTPMQPPHPLHTPPPPQPGPGGGPTPGPRPARLRHRAAIGGGVWPRPPGVRVGEGRAGGRAAGRGEQVRLRAGEQLSRGRISYTRRARIAKAERVVSASSLAYCRPSIQFTKGAKNTGNNRERWDGAGSRLLK